MKRFVHRHGPQATLKMAVLAGIGAGLAIALLHILQSQSAALWLIAPFGASCVLLFGAPGLPVSQPMNIVVGHVLSALIGIVVLQLSTTVGVSPGIAASIALGLAVFAMLALRIVHPPAGATAIAAVLTGADWTFLFLPVLAGSAVIVIAAVLWHAANGTPYPAPIGKS